MKIKALKKKGTIHSGRDFAEEVQVDQTAAVSGLSPRDPSTPFRDLQ